MTFQDIGACIKISKWIQCIILQTVRNHANRNIDKWNKVGRSHGKLKIFV